MFFFSCKTKKKTKRKKFAKNLKVVYQKRNATEYNNHDGRWRLKEKIQHRRGVS